MPRSARSAPPSREELKENLLIDDDDLDSALVEQASFFFQAAEASSLANSQRDTIKLELKELKAELDGDIRREAIRNEEKLTETQLTNRITTLPRIKEMERKFITSCKMADDCAALKDSYIQRSYALKDLTLRQNAQMTTLSIERGSSGAIRDAGSRAQEREKEFRRSRPPVSRFRPRDQGV
jgi:hypothetical protein